MCIRPVTTVIGLVGDVLVDRDDPPTVFRRIRSALDETDILFGNLERPYTDYPRLLADTTNVALVLKSGEVVKEASS